MSDLYYTQEEIDQLQKDIIEKYFNENDIHKNKEIYLYRFFNIRSYHHTHNDILPKIYDDIKNIIENIKKFKIIGYEEGTYNQFISHEYYLNNTPEKHLSRYVSFMNIYGDIFTGVINKKYYCNDKKSDNHDHKYCDNMYCNKDNNKILLKAFSKQIETRISNNPCRIKYSYKSFEIDIEKGILLPKIILKNIIDNNLIFQLSNKDYNKYKQLQEKFDSESSIDSNCSEKYKDFIDIIMKEREQQKEIEDLKSKLAEQTKLNDEICERMFELKEQLLQ
jgi:hypothetical protein